MRQLQGVIVALVLTGFAGSVQAENPPVPDGEVTVKAMTGACHCGRVTYRAAGPVIKCSTCDCAGCRRATGTLGAPFVTVKRQTVTVTAGETATFRSQSKEKCDGAGVWVFCPKCGTQLFWRGDRGDELDIFAGTLDDPSVFRPKE